GSSSATGASGTSAVGGPLSESYAANSPGPLICRMIAPWLTWLLASTAVELTQLLPASTAASTQPSAKPTMTWPVFSTVMSLKSSRLRQSLLPPAFQMQPRCTGSGGVASIV